MISGGTVRFENSTVTDCTSAMVSSTTSLLASPLLLPTTSPLALRRVAAR